MNTKPEKEKEKEKEKCKFRISVSIDQINWILDNCQEAMPDLHKQLSLMKMKAELGFIASSYTVKEKKEAISAPVSLQTRYEMAVRILDAGKTLPAELQAAYGEYRYLNDLMTPEEEAVFELENDTQCNESF